MPEETNDGLLPEDTAYVIDIGSDRVIYSPVCLNCRHFDAEKWLSNGSEICKAFRLLIPTEIWNGDNDHTQPYPGDGGVQFEPRGQ